MPITTKVLTPARFGGASGLLPRTRSQLKLINSQMMNNTQPNGQRLRRKLSVIEEVININNNLMNLYLNTRSKKRSLTYIINQIRCNILKQRAALDVVDVQKIEHDDSLITRFLRANENFEKCSDQEIIKVTTKLIKDALQWRCESRIGELTFADIDAKLLAEDIVGKSEIFHETELVNVIYFRLDRYRKTSTAGHAMSQMIAYLFEEIDRETYGQGKVRLIFDCEKFRLLNLDVNLMRQIFRIAFKYYPGLRVTIDNVDAPHMREAAVEVCSRILPQRQRAKIHFLTRHALIIELGAHNVPVFLGGDSTDVTWSSEFNRCYW